MLTELKLHQFRCFDTVQCRLDGSVSLFVGDNAQGKTSILEAVCIVLRLQSPRTSTLADVIRFGTTQFAVQTHFEDNQLRFAYSQSRRKLTVDGETMRKSGEYLRYSGLVVWMANDDLALIRGGGDGRRRYLDFMGSQLYPEYRPALRAYDRALRSRNYLLKRDASPNWKQIDAYTQILADHGATLTHCRRELAAQLQPFALTAQHEISGNRETLNLGYEPNAGDTLREALHDLRDEELRRRSTAAGPHRDDLIITLNDMPAAQFASEGQQRTIALALKLGQARLFRERMDRAPVLLLDDIFGELDPKRRNALIAGLPADSQKLITTTHLDWLEDALHPELIYDVAESRLSKRNA